MIKTTYHAPFRAFVSVLVCAALVATIFAGCANKGDTRLAVDKQGKTVVERYGHLKVVGTKLCNEAGEPVQLRGMSSNGLQWAGKYANKAVITWLRDEWNSQLWRAAMYLTEGGYIVGPRLKQKVIDSVEAARDAGVYVLIDWHVMLDRNPNAYKEQAVEFFTEMAERYGELPNVIYEICNEPNGDDVTWDEEIKPYAETVIAAIRKIDPDNIIVVGTPSWSQHVDKAADNPVTGYDNIMYTLHFYGGTHGQDLRDKAVYAMDKGIALFVTEWGTTLSTGDQFRPVETLAWIEFMDKHGLSWANWSVANDGKDSSILTYNADREGKGAWTEDQISASGKFVRGLLRNENPKRLVKEATKGK